MKNSHYLDKPTRSEAEVTQDTIGQAYEKALAATVSKHVPESQRHMVACLAVKDAMKDTLENLIALRNIMRARP